MLAKIPFLLAIAFKVANCTQYDLPESGASIDMLWDDSAKLL